MTMVQGHVSARGSVAGRYRLLEAVHRETNHVCWYGEDLEAERPRLLTQTVLPEGTGQDDARRITARIMRMSETMGLLRPGRIATVVDAVVEAGTLWTVTEWIDGTPLGELLAREGAFGHVRAARVGLELLDVLEAAHAEGVTHGELGPGQVFVRDRGGVVVTGFGLAGAALVPRLTAPSYASPEQARDERIGPAADLWALGALLYTMTEGRPPFRDRGRPEATLQGVVRLPLRAPLRAGPLGRAVQGLLRKDSRDRLTRPAVREALTRITSEDPGTVTRAVPRPRLRGVYAAVRAAGRARSGRTMVLGTTLAVATVTVAVLAAAHLLPGTGTSGSTAASGTVVPSSSPTGAGGRTGDGAPPPSATPGAYPSATPGASPSATATGLPAGFRVLDAPEGFSLALPEGWRRVSTTRVSGLAYRVVFGADGDARTLAVTYSTQAGPDPVVVWRDDVEPSLERQGAYRRIGDIRATTYQGLRAADMEWLSGTGNGRVRTFGRGFLLGG
ncbi:serine/threonine protein kinase, partial [Streptomyces kebangsaanensis]|uniref:serine/threonine protein kinase n=1 Tax=Streptomyces kebangsaanensis TaxID=864058 RepID=UPI0009A0CDE6